MNEISGMEGLIQSLRARDKVKHITYPHAQAKLTPIGFHGLQCLLECLDEEGFPQVTGFAHKKKEIKFYARTIYLALAIKCGDSATSPYMVTSIHQSSYYLAHKICLDPLHFLQFLSSPKMNQYGPYFATQEHQLLQNFYFVIHFSKGKVSTPYEFVSIVANSFNNPSLITLLNYLIDFALTFMESAEMSSEEIFVGCCLTAQEKMNSHSFLIFLMTYFSGSLAKGGQLALLMKEFFESMNNNT